MVNLSFSSGIFPRILKTALVIPLYKKGNPKLIDNYRPISLLPTVSKILERAISYRLSDFLERKNLLSCSQYGFRQGKSCEGAITELLTGVWDSGNDLGAVSGALFIDVSKAFDTVDHRLLLAKLQTFGVRGVPLDLLGSYLCERYQRVRISADVSDSSVSTCGVPQGSILGPLLFNLYINDIFNLDIKGRSIGYADDIAVSYSGVSEDSVWGEIDHDLAALRNWFDSQRMVLSDKSRVMMFHPGSRSLGSRCHTVCHSQNCDKPKSGPCVRDCVVIQRVDEFKYLGVWLDYRLSWRKHVTHLSQELRNLLRYCFMIRKLGTDGIVLSYYYAMVESKLRYGLPFWGTCCQTVLNPIVVLQKKVLRIMSKSGRFDHSAPLFSGWNILPLHALLILALFNNFCKHNDLESFVSGAGFSRSGEVVPVPRPKYQWFKRSLNFKGPTLINNLYRNGIPLLSSLVLAQIRKLSKESLLTLLSSRFE